MFFNFTGRFWAIIYPFYFYTVHSFIPLVSTKMCLEFTVLANAPTQVVVLPKCKILSLCKMRKHIMTYFYCPGLVWRCQCVISREWCMPATTKVQLSRQAPASVHLKQWFLPLQLFTETWLSSTLHTENYPWPVSLPLSRQCLVWHRYLKFTTNDTKCVLFLSYMI